LTDQIATLPYPKPTAQVEPYVEAFGFELAIKTLATLACSSSAGLNFMSPKTHEAVHSSKSWPGLSGVFGVSD
jgi:hypothetical protein